jgi:sugar/nucleoside kinase (ribokinase family)
LARPHVHRHGAKYGISVHHRKVRESSLSFIMPHGGKRAIVRCRDDDYLHPFPPLNLGECRALHVDGHQPDAAIHYARACREAGILTSLDGGGLRPNTHDLLGFIDVAIVAERLCEQMGLSPLQMLDYLKSRGCGIGGVTRGEWGMVWYDEEGETKTLPALDIPADQVVDTNGAGDIFHGSYVYSAMARPDAAWREHSSSRVPPRRTRSSTSATRRACRNLAAIAATQARYREKGRLAA